MPFLLKERRKKRKYRKISFFELSGEVIKYFYEIVNPGSNVLTDKNRKNAEDAFKTLKLLLNSNNQKIHYFFIDYNHEINGTNHRKTLNQSNYLESAATFFRDNSDIFKKKTDAVYVVITKADEIKGENKEKVAEEFLQNNFGSFLDFLEERCSNYSVRFEVMTFSIGKVLFKRICKLDHSYANEIIEDMLHFIRPDRENGLFKILNS